MFYKGCEVSRGKFSALGRSGESNREQPYPSRSLVTVDERRENKMETGFSLAVLFLSLSLGLGLGHPIVEWMLVQANSIRKFT